MLVICQLLKCYCHVKVMKIYYSSNHLIYIYQVMGLLRRHKLQKMVCCFAEMTGNLRFMQWIIVKIYHVKPEQVCLNAHETCL